MSEVTKSKQLIPVRQPFEIVNKVVDEDGVQVPVPIHIIVDNAADFPVCDCGGGGGGGVKRVLLPSPFAGAVEGMCDESAEFMIAITKPDAEDYDFKFVMFPAATGMTTAFIVEPDTSYFMFIQTNSGTMTFDPELSIEAHDVDNDTDLTSVCFPYDQYNHRYYVDVTENSVVIEFSIPLSAGTEIDFNFVSQK